MFETLFNEGLEFLSSSFVTKIILLSILLSIWRGSKRTKYIGYYMIAQDYAIKNTLLNGKGQLYDEFRLKKLKELMERNNFESKIKE